MNAKILVIPINKIKPLLSSKITKEYLKRMKKLKENHDVYDLLLPVEKHPDEDYYLLVGGFDKYQYICESKTTTTAMCIVETSSSNKEMLLKALGRLMPRGDSNKENRLQVIANLKSLGCDDKSISKVTGYSKRYLEENYSYDPAIPLDAIKENTVHKTLNTIARQSFSNEAKQFLYEQAALPKSNPHRLTGQVVSYITSFLKVDERFNMLTPNQQILTLDQAFHPKKTVIRKLMNTVSRFIPYKKTS